MFYIIVQSQSLKLKLVNSLSINLSTLRISSKHGIHPSTSDSNFRLDGFDSPGNPRRIFSPFSIAANLLLFPGFSILRRDRPSSLELEESDEKFASSFENSPCFVPQPAAKTSSKQAFRSSKTHCSSRCSLPIHNRSGPQFKRYKSRRQSFRNSKSVEERPIRISGWETKAKNLRID